MNFKEFLRTSWHVVKSQSLVRISKDPYSTHIPILIGLSKLYKIRSVLEYGSGPNSTKTFLDDNAFPGLKILISYENDIKWYENIKKITSHDSRISLNYLNRSMHHNVNNNEVKNSDLIFIDDSIFSFERAKTIRKVLSFKPRLVVIHDFENFAYRQAAFSQRNTYRFKALLPNTGIFADDLDIEKMQTLNHIISENRFKINNNDISAWVKVFWDIEL